MRTWTVHGVNFDVLAILLRDMAEQAVSAIRGQLDSFSFQVKDNPNKIDDQVTSADYEAQRVIVDMITKCFPEAGIIGEENNLKKPCTHPTQQLYFILDPLDWTRAYVRMQSDWIWSMIWVVLDGEIIGSAIADVMTKEIYLLNPATWWVERNHPLRALDLEYSSRKHFRIAMMEDPRLYSDYISRISLPQHWYFDSIGVTGGSIWLNVARVRKNEASAFLFRSWAPMPRDWVPVVWISLVMGFVFLSFNKDTHTWVKTEKLWSVNGGEVLTETLMIHKSEVDEFLEWYNK